MLNTMMNEKFEICVSMNESEEKSTPLSDEELDEVMVEIRF